MHVNLFTCLMRNYLSNCIHKSELILQPKYITKKVYVFLINQDINTWNNYNKSKYLKMNAIFLV